LEALEDRCVPARLDVISPIDNANQPYTLRWAVDQAKNGDVIDIQFSQPIVLTQGELYLAHDITIFAQPNSSGPVQATISGNYQSRIFEVALATHVNLLNLNLIEGNSEANNPKGTQGADGKGGAILNWGTLALTGCKLSDNGVNLIGTVVEIVTQLGGGICNEGGPQLGEGFLTLTRCDLHYNFAGYGGGIANVGGGLASVSVNQCDLTNNKAVSGGGGLANVGGFLLDVYQSGLDQNTAFEGGAIYNSGLDAGVNVSHCQFDGNLARQGGGIYNNDKCSVGANDCTFTDNYADFVGGGAIYSAGNLLVQRCDFEDNYSTGQAGSGGAIYSSGNAFFEECTLTQNSCFGLGGGIYCDGLTSLSQCTLTNNSASAGGGIYMDSKAILAVDTSNFSGNTPDNLDKTLGMFVDLGGNTGI
jgi:predicted outer membrane repeat protein